MIPSEIIKKVKSLDLKTRLPVQNILSGNYQSRFKGQGMTFSELREYQPGDDIRLIDWKHSEKMRSPYIKLFEEERELTVILAIDISASCEFASQKKSKKEQLLECAALIGFAAAKSRDKVGLLLFSNEIEDYVPPKKGKENILKLLRDIYCFKAKHRQTNIKKAATALLKNLKKRSCIFLMSDFQDQNYDQTFKRLSKKHDVIPIHISDPWEQTLKVEGSFLFRDPENLENYSITLNKQNLEQFNNIFLSEKQTTQKLFRQANCPGIQLSTSDEALLKIQSYFRQRKK